jgi:hypothetical protein
MVTNMVGIDKFGRTVTCFDHCQTVLNTETIQLPLSIKRTLSCVRLLFAVPLDTLMWFAIVRLLQIT